MKIVSKIVEYSLMLLLLSMAPTVQTKTKKSGKGEKMSKINIGQMCIMSIFVILVASIGVNPVSALAGNGTVILSFDDGWNDTYTQAADVLGPNNQSAVVFAITEAAIGATSDGWTDYMTTAQLATLYNRGWDISSHSLTHGSAYPDSSTQQLFYLTRANNTELKQELGDSKDWLDANGFTRSSMFFAYPFGTYDNAYCLSQYNNNLTICGTNDLTKEIKAAGYYIGARSIDAYSWRHPDPNGRIKPDGTQTGKHPKYKNGDMDSEVLKMATMAIDNTPSSYPSEVIDEINKTVTDNGLLIITFHHITTGNPTSAEEYSKTNLTKISNYLKNNSAIVKVQTFSQYFNVPIPIPTYNPGTPVVGTTIIGNNWLKAQWTDGTGDNTNVFDVLVKLGSDTVGKWTYNDVNRYINVTDVPVGVNVHVEITAINRSWGQTNKNNTPLVINAMILRYMPATPIDVTLPGSKNITWNAGYGNKTDYFNYSVNGTWYNGSTATFYDVTGLNPGVYTVIVYAVNTTNGNTVNNTPLVVGATIPVPLRYMPATPIDVTLPGSKNITWSAGYGNKTDYFNYSVNGTWYNGSAATFYDVTGLNPGVYTVIVYAVNTTNGNTVNNTNLTMSTEILAPGYMPPTPTINSTIGNDWILTEWRQGIGNVTDLYDVNINGLWYNSTTNTSYNATNLSIGNNTLVNVYAVNTTNRRTVNSTPATSNSTIPVPNFVSTPVLSHGGSGGSGGGSGGGGGNFYDDNVAYYELRDSQIINGTVSKITFVKNGLISEITVDGIKSYGDITAKVSLLKKNPTDVAIDNVYKFFSVNMGTIKHENERQFFINPTVTLFISKTNISDKDVKVYEFINGSWTIVNIEELAGTDDMRYFKLKLDGFSNFAIVLDPKTAVTDINSKPSLSGLQDVVQQIPQNSTSVPKSSGFEIVVAIGMISTTYIFARKRR